MSGRRILVLGAGTAAGENLIASLRDGDPSLALLGAHDDPFVLARSAASTRYLVPPARGPHFTGALRSLVAAARVDLVIPTSDGHVQKLSAGRGHFPGRVFLPSRAMVRLCHDKYALIRALRQRGLSAPATYPVTGRKSLDRIFGRLGDRGPLWCRPRTGTCARGGAAVANPEEAWRWIELWEAMQGVPVASFTLAAYLPGREILCQSVWRAGEMLLTSTFERLSYFGVDNIPSGVTSLSSLAKTVVEPEVVALCRRAIGAVSPKASGAFAVDVKLDGQGRPHVTEINAGRFFMAMTAFSRVLKHNMALIYVRAALGDRMELRDEYDAADEYYMVRDLDMPPGIIHGDVLFEGLVPWPVTPEDKGDRHGNGPRQAGRAVRADHRAGGRPHQREGDHKVQEADRRRHQGRQRDRGRGPRR